MTKKSDVFIFSIEMLDFNSNVGRSEIGFFSQIIHYNDKACKELKIWVIFYYRFPFYEMY